MGVMDKFFETISGWAPNRWLMFGGFLLMLLSVISAVAGFEIVGEMRLFAFGGGLILVMLGAWYARERARFEAQEKRRDGDERPRAPVSENSLDFAKQLTSPITMTEVDSIPPLPNDERKDSTDRLRALCRARLREAATDGTVVYYDAGTYYPRETRDHTVYGVIG